jgi:hypothetical protein
MKRAARAGRFRCRRWSATPPTHGVAEVTCWQTPRSTQRLGKSRASLGHLEISGDLALFALHSLPWSQDDRFLGRRLACRSARRALIRWPPVEPTSADRNGSVGDFARFASTTRLCPSVGNSGALFGQGDVASQRRRTSIAPGISFAECAAFLTVVRKSLVDFPDRRKLVASRDPLLESSQRPDSIWGPSSVV